MSSSDNPSFLRRAVRRVGGAAKTGLAGIGLAAVALGYLEYKRLNPEKNVSEDGKDQKKVLVIPFHELELVERKKQELSSFLDSKTTTMEVRELVDLLHKAASDDSITAIYGVFGHGATSIKQLGYAQLEEIRNALCVVKEAHRFHQEPNTSHEMQVIPRVQSKLLYAYADSFGSLDDPANKEYYLASVFTHLHMQEKGEVNLFGMHMPQFFLRDALEKYGIHMHVFKHGNYKTAPNMFTNRRLNSFHREQVETIQKLITADLDNDIAAARSKALLASWLTKKHKGNDEALWKEIHNSGTFSAEKAFKGGFIDYLPRRSPLNDLVKSNTDESVAESWEPQETDFKRFTAEKAVKIQDYATQHLSSKQQWWQEIASWLTGTTPAAKDKIALLHVNGLIGDEMANELVKAIQKIAKEDFKCLVVRVTSGGGAMGACETIHQELKTLDIPIVFSFGDVAASGGYYIASESANRIFCSHKTITGSIGVFGVRADLTGLASKYGVSIESVSAGDFSATYNSLAPMTRKMQENVGVQVDRSYAQFKQLVAKGRKMDMDQVEEVAQGKVWTGDQAKSIGLVDEVGGLHRALAYVERNYCTQDVEVEDFPEEPSFLEKLAKTRSGGAPVFGEADLASKALQSSSKLSGIMMTSDENAAIRCLLEEASAAAKPVVPFSLPSWFWN